MQLDKFLVGIVIFAVFIIFGILWITDTSNNYNVNMTDENFDAVFGNATQIIDESYDISQSVKDDTFGGDVEQTLAWESMITGAYSAIRLVSRSFGLIGNTLMAVSTAVGIPPFFITAGLAIMVILVIFALIYLVFRFQNR